MTFILIYFCNGVFSETFIRLPLFSLILHCKLGVNKFTNNNEEYSVSKKKKQKKNAQKGQNCFSNKILFLS